MVLIIAAVAGVLLEKSGRPGFWSSLLLVGIIMLITWFKQHHGKKRGQLFKLSRVEFGS